MSATKVKNFETETSPETTQSYIMQMLGELSLMAHASGLKNMATLLRATLAASQVDMHSDTES